MIEKLKFFSKLILKLRYQSSYRLLLKKDILGFYNSLPPPRLNFNQEFKGNFNTYISDFFDSGDKQLSELMNFVEFSEKSVTLDFGCGLGRIASAFSRNEQDLGMYFGWEPERHARSWLTQAYFENNKFCFGGSNLPKHLNYVERSKFGLAKYNCSAQGGFPKSKSLETFLGGRIVTVGITTSVFTHMWPEDALQVLKQLSNLGDKNSVWIDTWLAIDETALSSLQKGQADRSLPIQTRGIYTYSRRNPLVCTAYPLELVESLYLQSGRRVIKILFGEWSGRYNSYSYQDVFITKLI